VNQADTSDDEKLNPDEPVVDDNQNSDPASSESAADSAAPADETPAAEEAAAASDETGDDAGAAEAAESPAAEDVYLGDSKPGNTIQPVGSDGDGPKMDWYILKVAFNREDSIADGLRKRVMMEGMQEFFGDIVVPTEDVATFTRDGKRRISKRKLLPGYIMVNMIINDDTWFLVRETGGISDFTGAAGKPMPMEPSDVDRFINRPVEEGEEEAPIKTAIPFKVGDRVRVKEGNFENQEGDVDSVDEASGHITVIINIFGRSVPMELSHWQVEPL
tara:strand:- start:13859 stop:14683 length:825 start_codon:yes stop_codon:yes gene_type:complete